MTVIFFTLAQISTTQKPLYKSLSITFLNGRIKLASNFLHQNAKQFFSTEKTKLFFLQLKCKNTILAQTNSIRLLGLTFDHKLKWTAHNYAQTASTRIPNGLMNKTTKTQTHWTLSKIQ
jgi:hypothetical protein